jgi:hypothetical protein
VLAAGKKGGKTSDYLLGRDKLVRFDMSEYQTLESIYRLLG